MGYNELTENELAWMENREAIVLQGRQILRRVMNVALLEMHNQFQAGLHRGEILDMTADKDALKSMLLRAAQRELSPVKELTYV